MRILFLAAFGTCQKQTTFRRLLPLARSLAARGHEIALLIPAWDCPAQAGQQRREDRVLWWAPPLGPGGKGIYPSLPARLHRHIARFHPHVLVVSKGLGYAGEAARWWMKREGRVVVDVDDLEVAWMQHQGRHPWLIRGLAHQERALIRSAAGVLVASRFLQSHWPPTASSFPYYLPNGLTPAPTRTPVESHPPRILLISRGHDVDRPALARVWAYVRQKVPQASLWLVGGMQWNVEGVRGFDWLIGNDYAQILQQAALCLFLPTKNPLVQAKSPARVLDCIAHGIPVITRDVGEYGLYTRQAGLNPARHDTHLMEQLCHLLQDPHARGRLSQEVFARTPSFAWDRRAADVEAWLKTRLQPSTLKRGRR